PHPEQDRVGGRSGREARRGLPVRSLGSVARSPGQPGDQTNGCCSRFLGGRTESGLQTSSGGTPTRDYVSARDGQRACSPSAQGQRRSPAGQKRPRQLTGTPAPPPP